MAVVSLCSWRQEGVVGRHFIEMTQIPTPTVKLSRSLTLADESAASP